MMPMASSPESHEYRVCMRIAVRVAILTKASNATISQSRCVHRLGIRQSEQALPENKHWGEKGRRKFQILAENAEFIGGRWAGRNFAAPCAALGPIDAPAACTRSDAAPANAGHRAIGTDLRGRRREIGRASWRERV